MMSPVGRAVSVLGTALALIAASAGVALGRFSEPRAITPRADGLSAEMFVQDADRQGDTTFAWLAERRVRLRVLRTDGSLTRVRTVDVVDYAISVMGVAVDDDGHGVVIWDELQGPSDRTNSLFARRVTRSGRLGRVRRIAPRMHNVIDAQVTVGPHGQGVVTWSRLTHASYTPWMRTFGLDGSLGRVHRVGRGPNAGAPRVDVDRRGRALLAWSNGPRVLARRVSRSGSLGPKVRIYRGRADAIRPTAVAVDRDGRALVTWIRVSGFRNQVWGRRISRGTRPLGKARLISHRGQLAVWNDTDMDLQGDAVVAWNVGYFEGVFARRIHRDGRMGPRVRLGTGGLATVALDDDGDGAIAWAGLRDGVSKAIRVTRVRRGGAFGRTATVGLNGADTGTVTADTAPRGRITVAWPRTPPQNARVLMVRGRR